MTETAPKIYKTSSIKEVKLSTLNTTKTDNQVKFDLWDEYRIHDEKNSVRHRQIFVRLNNVRVVLVNDDHFVIQVSEDQDNLIKEFEQEIMQFISFHVVQHVNASENKLSYLRLLDANTRIIQFNKVNNDYGPQYYINKQKSSPDEFTKDSDCDVIMEITEIVLNKMEAECTLLTNTILRQARCEKYEPQKHELLEYSFSDAEEDSDPEEVIELNNDDSPLAPESNPEPEQDPDPELEFELVLSESDKEDEKFEEVMKELSNGLNTDINNNNNDNDNKKEKPVEQTQPPNEQQANFLQMLKQTVMENDVPINNKKSCNNSKNADDSDTLSDTESESDSESMDDKRIVNNNESSSSDSDSDI